MELFLVHVLVPLGGKATVLRKSLIFVAVPPSETRTWLRIPKGQLFLQNLRFAHALDPDSHSYD